MRARVVSPAPFTRCLYLSPSGRSLDSAAANSIPSLSLFLPLRLCFNSHSSRTLCPPSHSLRRPSRDLGACLRHPAVRVGRSTSPSSPLPTPSTPRHEGANSYEVTNFDPNNYLRQTRSRSSSLLNTPRPFPSPPPSATVHHPAHPHRTPPASVWMRVVWCGAVCVTIAEAPVVQEDGSGTEPSRAGQTRTVTAAKNRFIMDLTTCRADCSSFLHSLWATTHAAGRRDAHSFRWTQDHRNNGTGGCVGSTLRRSHPFFFFFLLSASFNLLALFVLFFLSFPLRFNVHICIAIHAIATISNSNFSPRNSNSKKKKEKRKKLKKCEICFERALKHSGNNVCLDSSLN